MTARGLGRRGAGGLSRRFAWRVARKEQSFVMVTKGKGRKSRKRERAGKGCPEKGATKKRVDEKVSRGERERGQGGIEAVKKGRSAIKKRFESNRGDGRRGSNEAKKQWAIRKLAVCEEEKGGNNDAKENEKGL